MGMMPAQFWSLLVREFWIKHDAFRRAEDRKRALVMEHASLVAHRKKKDQNDLIKNVNLLRRYPVKPWLK